MSWTVEPTLITPPAPQPAVGHWLRRGCRALLLERRLPTRAAAGLDRLLIALGRPTRTLRVGEARIRVRRLEADEHYVREVLVQHAYNPPGYRIGEEDTVVDVGGNIGAFAVHAGLCARRGRVITVEPIEANYSLLLDNLAGNRLSHVTAVRAAVVGSPAPLATVYLSRLGTGHHSTRAELAGPAAGAQQVPAVRLEELWQRYGIRRCDYLKLDCEGAEFEILDDLPLEIARRIGKLALEYHVPSGMAKRAEADRLVSRLQHLGFAVDIYTDVLGTQQGMIFARRDAPAAVVE